MASFKNLFNRFCKSENLTTSACIVGGTTAIITLGTLFSFTTIPTGHVGYKSLYGNVYDKQYQSGFTFINPLSDMIILDLHKKVAHSESLVSSNEGLEIKVDVDVVHRLDRNSAKDIYVNVGTNYTNVLLIPQLNSCIRNAVSGFNAKDLYNDKSRIEIKDKILSGLSQLVSSGIIIEDVLINKIVLPTNLAKSIENKLKIEQEMEQMNFVLEKERKESQRKQIEAEGIKAFQDTVAQDISPELLMWKGITATEELAKSNNAKIIMFGNSQHGLPLVYSDNRN